MNRDKRFLQEIHHSLSTLLDKERKCNADEATVSANVFDNLRGNTNWSVQLYKLLRTMYVNLNWLTTQLFLLRGKG